MPALTAAADATTTLRLGTMVLANDYRHPVVVAKEAATVDVLSGGRFELGIGAGWTTTDYEEAGIPLDRPGVRIARLSEAIDVIRGLWADGPRRPSPATTTGSPDGRPPEAGPAGGPPIVVGGGGERLLRLAAAKADIVGINVNLAAGVIDERAFPDGVPGHRSQARLDPRGGRRPVRRARAPGPGPPGDGHRRPRRLIDSCPPAFGLTPRGGRPRPPRADRLGRGDLRPARRAPRALGDQLPRPSRDQLDRLRADRRPPRRHLDRSHPQRTRARFSCEESTTCRTGSRGSAVIPTRSCRAACS